MQIEESIIRDINAVAEWLSDNRSAANIEADLIVLAGHAVVPAILGVMTLAAETGIPLLFTGGLGHSTEPLRRALAENPLTRHATFSQPGEAEIFFALAREYFAIPPSRLYVEGRSANCGENASFTRDMILEKQIRADSILLSQDPLMQRRTRETFEFSWRQKNLSASFFSWPVFVPQLVSIGGAVTVTGPQSAGIWPVKRLVSMLLGEMRRLKDDATGYGPAGAGFIGHVEIPQRISEAWDRIRNCDEYAQLSRA